MKRFKECLGFVLKWEGGFTNHPNDPGGPTNMGITQGVYDAWRRKKGLPPKSVRDITREEVEQIYWERYWQPLQADKIPMPLDLVVFDSGVNCGIGRAALWLNLSLGLPKRTAVTNETLSALSKVKDVKAIARKVCNLREAHYRTIAEKNPKLKVFLRGWLNRLTDLKKQAGL